MQLGARQHLTSPVTSSLVSHPPPPSTPSPITTSLPLTPQVFLLTCNSAHFIGHSATFLNYIVDLIFSRARLSAACTLDFASVYIVINSLLYSFMQLPQVSSYSSYSSYTYSRR